MAFTLTKAIDGDDVWSRKRLEHVVLQPSISDYVPGGYLIQGISGTTERTSNVGLAKVSYVIPVGGQGGWSPVWNPTTSKLQVFGDSNAANGAAPEVGASTDLSAYAFNLLVIGY